MNVATSLPFPAVAGLLLSFRPFLARILRSQRRLLVFLLTSLLAAPTLDLDRLAIDPQLLGYEQGVLSDADLPAGDVNRRSRTQIRVLKVGSPPEVYGNSLAVLRLKQHHQVRIAETFDVHFLLANDLALQLLLTPGALLAAPPFKPLFLSSGPLTLLLSPVWLVTISLVTVLLVAVLLSPVLLVTVLLLVPVLLLSPFRLLSPFFLGKTLA